MATNKAICSDLAIPPGEYLEEVIEELGMSKDELARRMNRPAPKLSAIFKGDKAITPDTAIQLEKVVGVPAHIWAGLEAEYRLALARKQELLEQNRLKKESHLVASFRYADLVKLEVVEKQTRPVQKVLTLQKFFGVTSLKTISRLRRYQAAFRTGNWGRKKRSPEAIAAWLRIGELRAQKQECASFKIKKIRETLQVIRDMTQQSPEQFQDDLHRRLADAGVALVLCPHLPKTYVHGATFWLGREKAVVMMTIRCKWADIFWFSLFHELGHILLHDRQAIFLEMEDGDPILKEKEREADHFAADTLIPPTKYQAFIQKRKFYKENIIRFAEEMGILPGVVVGRLQHDGYIQREWHNDLRTRYEWKP